MADYDVGDVARLEATFRDTAGVLTNTTVTLTVKKPDGTSSTPSTSNPSTGLYRADISIDQPGVWVYRFAGTGAVTSVEEGRLYVRRSGVL